MTLDQLIAAFKQLPDSELGYFGEGKGACVQMTRIFIRVCKHFGFHAEPLAVAAAVWNSRWSVGVGFPTDSLAAGAVGLDREGWNGHLVVWLPEHRVLIDPTLHINIRRAQHGLVIEGMVCTPMPDGWETSPHGADLSDPCSNVRVFYMPLRDDTWRHSHAWQGEGAAMRSWAKDIITKVEASGGLIQR